MHKWYAERNFGNSFLRIEPRKPFKLGWKPFVYRGSTSKTIEKTRKAHMGFLNGSTRSTCIICLYLIYYVNEISCWVYAKNWLYVYLVYVILDMSSLNKCCWFVRKTFTSVIIKLILSSVCQNLMNMDNNQGNLILNEWV